MRERHSTLQNMSPHEVGQGLDPGQVVLDALGHHSSAATREHYLAPGNLIETKGLRGSEQGRKVFKPAKKRRKIR